MSDLKDFTTKSFDPMVCGDGCCESLKWECNPKYCYPILAKRVFSCTELHGTPMQSSPFNGTFITDIPKLIKDLEDEEVCILSVESVKYKCLGLRQNSNGTEPPNPIQENINFDLVNFDAITSAICTGPAPNAVNIFTKYQSLGYQVDVSIDDLCNKTDCETADGVKLNTYFTTDQYGVYNLEIKVKARLKNDVSGLGEFTGTFVIPDPAPNAGPGDTNFLLSELGFGPVNFYGNVCFPINKACDIYKTFGGNFESACVNNAGKLSRANTNENYTFTALAILCFCPTETIHVVIEEMMGVNGMINPNKCTPVKPCSDVCDKPID